MENNNIKPENENIVTGTEESTEPKKKSKLPYIIFGILAVIAIAVVIFIFRGLNNSEVIDNQEIPSEPEEIQVGLTDYSATKSEFDELKTVNKAFDEYVDKHYEDMGIASAYGFLYSIETGNNIMVKDLMSEGLINPSKNIAENTDVLYMKAVDFGLDNNDYIVCTAFNTKDGYYVSSVDLEGKYYTEHEYHDMVFKYSFVHGEIINPKKGDDNYKKITEAAAVSEGYDIKHIACDDKYAVVVGNRLDNTAEFVEAVLVKNGDNWSVGIGNIAKAKNSKQAANKNYPDMELGLMPIYNIGDYTRILASMPEITNQLVELGEVDKAEVDNLYFCSAGNFAYVETPSGKKLLGYLGENDKLDFNEMSSLEHTISTMVNLESDPPVFIIKFN